MNQIIHHTLAWVIT